MEELFHSSGKWFRGNLHTHTTLSDGRYTPERAAALYRDAGYDFIALTDHWVQGSSREENGILILNGCEWDTGDMVNTPVYHILGIGMTETVPSENLHDVPAQEIIDAINAAGGAAILAHPTWSLTDPQAAMKLKDLCAAEIYNTVSGVPWNGSRADASLYFDLWASKGKLFRCSAADDTHFYNGDQTTSYVMVNADDCTPESLMSALRAGNFYASQGPRFTAVRFGQGTVETEFTGAERAVFYSNTVWCDDRVADGTTGFASYRIKSTDSYVRIELIGPDGKRAWCSPFSVRGDR